MEVGKLTSPSFKEDSYFITKLKPSEKKALQDLKSKLSSSNETSNTNHTIWGIPLISTENESSDVILLKFLKAKVKKFLRWRIQVLERGVKKLDFRPGGVNSMIQVTDLKDMPKRELRVASNQILSLFQDNYPELVARKIFINVPWYFSLLYSMFSPFLTLRTKSKFVIAKEGNVAETLYKFIRPEDIPVQYGGLSRPSDLKVSGPAKPASEFTVKGGEKVNIQIEGIEVGATITWDIVVGGWDLDYSAEFIPNAQDSYALAISKARKVGPTEEAVHNSFTAKEPGKLVLSVDNTRSRTPKVSAYRYSVRKALVASPSLLG